MIGKSVSVLDRQPHPTEHSRRRIVIMWAICHLACFAALSGGLPCKTMAAEDSKINEWSVKYELGSEAVRRGDTVIFAITAERMTVRNTKGIVLFAFPTALVRELAHDAEKSSVFVNVSWQDDFGNRRVMFKVAKKQASGLISELEKVTGRKCQSRLLAEQRSADKADIYSYARLVVYQPGKGGLAGDGRDEEAFRLPVEMARLLKSSCKGFLYLSRSRILFDPVFSPECGRYRFDLPRSAVTKIEYGPSPTIAGHRVDVSINGNVYRFFSIFDGEADKEHEFWYLFRKAVDNFESVATQYRAMTPQPAFEEPAKGRVWFGLSRHQGNYSFLNPPRLRITLSEGQLRLERDLSAATLSISVSNIAEVVHETERTAVTLLNSPLACLAGWPGLISCTALYLVEGLIHGQVSYFHIFWSEPGSPEKVTSFEADPEKTVSLLAEVAKENVKRTAATTIQPEVLRTQIEREKESAVSIFFNEETLKPKATRPSCDVFWFQRYPVRTRCDYQLLLLRTDDKHGKVLLVQGNKVRFERVVAFFPVETTSLSETEFQSAEDAGRVQFQTDHCSITEIRVGKEVLKLPPAPPLQDAVP